MDWFVVPICSTLAVVDSTCSENERCLDLITARLLISYFASESNHMLDVIYLQGGCIFEVVAGQVLDV